MQYKEQGKCSCFCVKILVTNGEFKEKDSHSRICCTLVYGMPFDSLIQGPRRGCSERRLFGVSIATATKLPLQRPPESCVSTFYPLSRPIESYHDCNHSERKRHGSHTKIHRFSCLEYYKDLIKNNCYWHENLKFYLYKIFNLINFLLLLIKNLLHWKKIFHNYCEYLNLYMTWL